MTSGGEDLLMRGDTWEDVEEAEENFKEIQTKGRVYRGMTDQEFENTLGSGKPIQSRGDYSFESEGTSFSDDPGVAEDYVNFGRDDPRKTGISNWLVEVRRTESMYDDRDGYIKDPDPVMETDITRVWEMYPEDDRIFARLVYQG